MQEIESKRKLRASEGAHFFFTLIFLSASGIIKFGHPEKNCLNLDLNLLIDLVFYGLILWGTYLAISIVPRYKNPAIKIFFNFLDLCFAIYLFVLFVFANKLYYAKDYNKCTATVPLSAYFTELFLIVTFAIFILLALALLSYLFKRIARKGIIEEEDDIEE